jgi:hypothetical protein
MVAPVIDVDVAIPVREPVNDPVKLLAETEVLISRP